LVWGGGGGGWGGVGGGGGGVVGGLVVVEVGLIDFSVIMVVKLGIPCT